MPPLKRENRGPAPTTADRTEFSRRDWRVKAGRSGSSTWIGCGRLGRKPVFALYWAEGKVEPTSALRSDTLDAIGLTPQRAWVAHSACIWQDVLTCVGPGGPGGALIITPAHQPEAQARECHKSMLAPRLRVGLVCYHCWQLPEL